MQTRNGFSLLEMLICVSLVLIFASFAVPRFSSATKTAQEAKVQAERYLQFKPLTPDKGEYQIADGVVSADYNNKHFSSDAASAQEGKG